MLAPRGKILDRDGRVIVDNHSSFSVILSRRLLKDEHCGRSPKGSTWITTNSPRGCAASESRPKYDAASSSRRN